MSHVLNAVLFASREKTSAAVILVGCLLMFGNSTVAITSEQQTLFGKTYPPCTSTSRDHGFDERAKWRLDCFRKYGTKNGLLAQELLSRLSPSVEGAVTPEVHAAYEELIKIYPLIPSGSQRYLASELVSVGERIRNTFDVPPTVVDHKSSAPSPPPSPTTTAMHEEMGNGMIKAALTAALANNWLLSSYFREKLQPLSADPIFRDPVTSLLTREPLEPETQFESVLLSAEKLLEGGHPKVEYKKRELSEYVPQPSWAPKFEMAITRPDGTKKEIVATSNSGTIRKSIYPHAEVGELTRALKKLGQRYPKLSEPSKEEFVCRLLELTSKLQYSNIQPEAEKLFWIVFQSIDSSWLEENSLGDALGNNSPFFAQTNKLDKAAKIYQKEIEIDDLFNGGRPSNSNLYYVLGDTYDQMGRLDDAKNLYEIAKSIDIESVRLGILSANKYMQRNDDVRKGNYVSP